MASETKPTVDKLESEMSTLTFDANLKKKTRQQADRQKKKELETNDEALSPTQQQVADENVHNVAALPQQPMPPFYAYEQLLKRAFEQIREKMPPPNEAFNKPFQPKGPQVARIGSKKTCVTNFEAVVKSLRRPAEHVKSFILCELGTSGSLDHEQALIIHGRFQPSQIESLLKNYIKEYIICHVCKSFNTELEKRDGFHFVQCGMCKARQSVASIRTGFRAQVGRRALARAQQANVAPPNEANTPSPIVD